MTRGGVLPLVAVALMLSACGSVARPGPTPSPQSSAVPSPAPSFAPYQLVKAGAPHYGTAVDFQEVGLAPGETVTYSASADATMTYSCGGGSLTATRQLSVSQSLTADASGAVTGRVSLEMPPPTCSNGRPISPFLFETKAAVLTDTVHGATMELPNAYAQFG